MSWNRNSISFAIFLGSLLLFVPFLGGSHLFDWDEVNFAEAAREMLVTGEFSYVQINFKPFWEKPPLFIWMQALSMSAFGINEFAARFPNAICGALTLVVLFNIGSKLVSNRFGLLWILVYAGSLLPQFYFRSGIIDPWFNLFIFLGIHQLIRATENEILNRKHLGISAFLIGFAVMTKGPTAFGLVGISVAVYFITSFKKHHWKVLDGMMYSGIVIAVGFSWFLLEIARGHGYVIQEAIDYHIRLFSQSEAGHGQPFFYHPLVLLLGCFPMSLFLIFSWTQKTEAPTKISHYKKWMTILFWVVLILFSIVKTKIVHYSSLTYFPISFLVAWFIHHSIQNGVAFKNWHKASILFFGIALGSAFVLIGMLDTIKKPILSLLKSDGLAYGNFSQTVPDGRFDALIGIFFLIGTITSVLFLNRNKNAVAGLFATSLITVTLLSAVIAPKIDSYTQTSLFNFYKEKAGEYYLQPLGFHSYAHLFYGQRKPIPVETDDEPKWMVFEKVDRPVYFISRIQDLNSNLGYFPHLKEIDRKGGYVILERTDSNYPFLELP
ncbi:MAG: glycosyltransferase family 39 protein [Flavobacteriales bacterium]|nr:glycosyltransferase family 39 protein [Flavobacteriales bacterium]